MYIKKDLQLLHQITVDGFTDTVEVNSFDFADINWEMIANDAQERLLNLIVRRQTLNIDNNEVMQCIMVPIQQELRRFNNGK